MGGTSAKRERMSIDVLPEEHRRIKAFAAFHGESIREYVLESVRKRLQREQEETQLAAMTTKSGRVMREAWDNEKDAEYDTL